MQTYSFCFDSRAAREFPSSGLLTQELADRLISCPDHERPPHLWGKRETTLFISHPNQSFVGELERVNTRLALKYSPFNWIWQRKLLRDSKFSAFHRFCPIDKLSPSRTCRTLTTLLPPLHRMPFFISRSENHHYIVPSETDARILQRRYKVRSDQISTVVPTIRSCFQDRDFAFQEPTNGWLLFLASSRREFPRLKKLLKVVRERYPSLRHKRVFFTQRETFRPDTWLKLLQNTTLCFYLTSLPLDWATPFLESIYAGVPTLFCDRHNLLAELLPESPLRLNSFLVNQPDLRELQAHTEAARRKLELVGMTDPSYLIHQYSDIYSRLTLANA